MNTTGSFARNSLLLLTRITFLKLLTENHIPINTRFENSVDILVFIVNFEGWMLYHV